MPQVKRCFLVTDLDYSIFSRRELNRMLKRNKRRYKSKVKSGYPTLGREYLSEIKELQRYLDNSNLTVMPETPYTRHPFMTKDGKGNYVLHDSKKDANNYLYNQSYSMSRCELYKWDDDKTAWIAI